VIDDEIPKSFARVIGHACGAIAVGLTASSLFGMWAFAHKPTLPLLLAVVGCTGLSLLMFRWAGALTGFWDTRGKLAVPKFVYSAFGALLVAFTVLCVALAVARPPASIGEGMTTVIGVSSGIAMTYLCYLAYHRFK
jgi:hypothetical protein